MTDARKDKTSKPIAAPCLTGHFWQHVERTDGCWLWTGPISDGYGMTRNGNRPVRAHRLSYAVFNGDIPPGALVCHSCDNRRCVNPEHLWLGSHKDNTQDAVAKGRFSAAVCKRGHPFNAETTYMDPKGGKRCRVCQRDYERERYALGFRGRRNKGFSHAEDVGL